MSITYLQIVNDAIAECKVSLDPLTAVNFDDPPRTALYNHFKRWGNSVYKELMIDRPQWFFRNERAKIQLRPRLHLSGLSYVPSIGDVLIGQTSGVQFTVEGIHTFEQNELDPSISYTVDVTFGDEYVFDFNEVLDRVSPSPATSVGYVAHSGRYNFADDIVGFDQLNVDNVKAYYLETNTGDRLTYVDWINWVNRNNTYPFVSADKPAYITQAPDGNYEFYPQPISPFNLEVEYTRSFEDMVTHDDTPVGVPTNFEKILVWLTVAEYADFDNNSRLYVRAAKKLAKYDYYMARDELPTISFERSRF